MCATLNVSTYRYSTRLGINVWLDWWYRQSDVTKRPWSYEVNGGKIGSVALKYSCAAQLKQISLYSKISRQQQIGSMVKFD
jgi:hypothetical protein